MNQRTRMFPRITRAVAVAIGCLASHVASAQTGPGPDAFFITKGAIGDCGPGPVTVPAGVAMLPPPGIVGAARVQVRQFADPPAETPKAGAPYSAVGTTETVQTLADGNRIVHTNTSHYYRDRAGRTRTELSLSAVGPFTLDESHTVVMISDPVAKQRFVVHPDQKRAEALPQTPSPTGLPVTATVRCTPAAGLAPATTVSLGEKTLAGLQVTGTRTEYTIPAGQIGNEQPITVTSEHWVNQELGVTVASTVHDPMIGDTQFHLSQVERTEPDGSLFVVPADYTVTDVTANKPVTIQR